MISCILLPFSKKSTLRPFNIISECPMLYLFYPLYKICENFIYIPPRKSYSFSPFFSKLIIYIFEERDILMRTLSVVLSRRYSALPICP